jgi:hypothetical protein
MFIFSHFYHFYHFYHFASFAQETAGMIRKGVHISSIFTDDMDALRSDYNRPSNEAGLVPKWLLGSARESINKIKNDMKGARGTMKNRFQNLFSPKTGRDNDHPSHQDDDAAAVTQRRPSTGDKGTVIAGGGSLISPSALLSLKSIAEALEKKAMELHQESRHNAVVEPTNLFLSAFENEVKVDADDGVSESSGSEKSTEAKGADQNSSSSPSNASTPFPSTPLSPLPDAAAAFAEDTDKTSASMLTFLLSNAKLIREVMNDIDPSVSWNEGDVGDG